MDSLLTSIQEIDKSNTAFSIQCDIVDLAHHIQIKEQDLTIISQNICSIYSNIEDLQLNLTYLNFTPDLLILTECWLSSNKPIPCLDYYTSFQTTNHLNKNDGVVTYIKPSISANIEEINLTQASCIQIEIENNIVLGIYRSPSNRNADLFIDSLSSHLNTIKSYKNIIITGDININLIPKPCDNSYELSNRINFLNMLAMHGILPGHVLPTRKGSCLDHFNLKLNREKFSAHIAILNTTITDHSMTILQIKNILKKQLNIKYKSVTNLNQALLSLADKNLNKLLFIDNPNRIIDELIIKITETIADNTKIIKVPKNRRNIKPWITPGILRCISNRNKMQKKLKADPHNIIKEVTYKRYRNFCNNLIKKLKRKYDRDQLSKSMNNTKSLWKKIKAVTNLTSNKTDNTKLLKIKHSADESVNFVNGYFSNIGKNLAEEVIAMKDSPQLFSTSNLPPILDSSFVLLDTTPGEVNSVLMSLKSDSAPGWDNISTGFLKYARNEVVPIICHLANVCFSKGVFPAALKQAIITPVHKSGDRDDVNNYRPISVLPVISKILEKLINDRLHKYLEKFKIISDSQFGFRHGRSTEDAVAALSSHIVDQLDRKHKCLAVFIDLKKAFDTVSVPILVQKLECIGIRGTPLALLKDYLTDRKQKVKIGQSISDTANVLYGVPQGSVLGPTLFLVYINDLCNLKVESGRVFSYADDTALVFSGPSWKDVQLATEKGLVRVANWLQRNLLSLNISKTKYICFSIYNNSQPDTDFNIKVHTCGNHMNDDCTCISIDKVTSTKYLGVMIDQRLSWYAHIDLVGNRIRKLTWIFKNLRHVASVNLLTRVYVALAQAVITYCIPIWGGAYKTKFIELERAQRHLIKVMFFKPYRFPTEKLYEISNLLTVRKLYVLYTILRLHKSLTYDPTILTRRRHHAVAGTRSCNTLFAQKQLNNQSAHLYNQINKILFLYPKTLYENKKALTIWIKTINYKETEKILEYNT